MLAIALAAAIAAIAFQLGDDQSLPDADLRSGRLFIQDNLWSTDNGQYATWVDGAGTPYVAKRADDNADWEIVALGDLPGNPLASPSENDLHNANVVGVDAEGHIHVMGNMHGDGLRYVRSTRPGDITEWEAAEVAGDATRVTYPKLVTLPDDTLLFFRREGSAGNGAILLDALAPGTEDWEHVGTVLDGQATDESPYLHRVAVDQSSGTIHLAFVWRATPDPKTNNDVGYARSDDGGRTWQTSDGRELELPITHPEAEIVLDTAPEGSGLINNGGMTVDAEGRPHAIVLRDPAGGSRSLLHLWFDGTRWQHQPLDGSAVDGRPSVAATPDGRVWLLGTRGTEMYIEEITPGERGDAESFGRVPAGWETVYDSQALLERGTIELLVPDDDEPNVVVIDPE